MDALASILFLLLCMYLTVALVHAGVKIVRYWRNPELGEMNSLIWILKVAVLEAQGNRNRWLYARLLAKKPFTAELMAASLIAEMFHRDPVRIARYIEHVEAKGAEMAIKGFSEGWDEDD